jgi:uncharacterized membrane protein YphA (DoxX/SURF4 family)
MLRRLLKEAPGKMNLAVRVALIVLFAVAATKKLYEPTRLLTPLHEGLGLSQPVAAAAFVAVIAILLSVCLVLVFRPSAGLAAAGLFFIVGAGYAVLLDSRSYQGPCGCGIASAADSANPLRTHAYQNTACAALCLFLTFRARPGGVGHDSFEAS